MLLQSGTCRICLVILCALFLHFADATPIPLPAPTVLPLSNLTVSVSWDPLPGGSPTSPILYTLVVNGKQISSIWETYTTFLLSDSGTTIYDFQVCTSLLHTETCPAPATTFTWTTQPVFTSDDQVLAYTISPTEVGIIWQDFGGSITNKTEYVVQEFYKGDWRTAANIQAITTPSPYILSVPINAGDQIYYRVYRADIKQRTSSVFYSGAPNNFQQRTPTMPGVEITTLVPSSIKFSGARNSVSVNDSMLVTFDLDDPDIPSCSLLYARLVITQVAGSIQSGGFLRVFSDFEGCTVGPNVDVSACQPVDPNYYHSDPLQQLTVNGRPPVNKTLNIDLNNPLPSTNSLLSKLAARTSITFLITLTDVVPSATTSLNILDSNNVKLQIASQISYTQEVQSTVLALPTNTTTPFQLSCPGFKCYLSTPQTPFVLSFTDTTVGNSRVLTRAVLRVSGSFESAYYTVGMDSGVIFDGILGPPVSSCPPVAQSLESPNNYTLIAKGWPNYKYGQTNSINIISTSPFCLESAAIDLYYDTVESSDPCIPSFSATPSPSLSASRTPSVSLSPSSSSPPTLTAVPTPTTTSTSSTSRTPSRTPTISNTASPSPSVQTPSVTPSRTFLRSVDVLPPVPLPSSTSTPAIPISSSSSATPLVIPTSSVTPSCQRNCQQAVQPVVTNPGTGPVIVESETGTPIATVVINTPDTLIVGPVLEPVPAVDIVRSTVISLTLVDAVGNIVQPSSAVEICFAVDEDTDTKNSCLGYIDNTVSPSIWRCEDKCLQKNTKNSLCGKTKHFTSFAILLTGDNGNECGDADHFIFDEQWKDGALIGSVAGAILFCLIVIAVVLALTPCGRLILRGEEGNRIHKLRRRERNATSSDAEVDLEVV